MRVLLDANNTQNNHAWRTAESICAFAKLQHLCDTTSLCHRAGATSATRVHHVARRRATAAWPLVARAQGAQLCTTAHFVTTQSAHWPNGRATMAGIIATSSAPRLARTSNRLLRHPWPKWLMASVKIFSA